MAVHLSNTKERTYSLTEKKIISTQPGESINREKMKEDDYCFLRSTNLLLQYMQPVSMVLNENGAYLMAANTPDATRNHVSLTSSHFGHGYYTNGQRFGGHGEGRCWGKKLYSFIQRNIECVYSILEGSSMSYVITCACQDKRVVFWPKEITPPKGH